ncbi:hypothetical protein BAE44_0008710 [Dichanthelium oligosanthes]|uniref:Uncharacterized protein n=1 Tax=Dichanthelium oligosanthes TaxID=888268 RepID=A0A1E5VYV8_9POAL|nr:hypothetical protein BAE44_0008710 [Dichanthelium oligosanthes]
MNSINMSMERRLSAKMGSTLNESGYERRKQFNCYFPDLSENHNADPYLENEDMFYEPQAEKEWQSKHVRSDGNLVDEDSDRLWRVDQFNSEDHFPNQREEHFHTGGYGFEDKYSPERRNSTRSSTGFKNTGIPLSHDLFYDHSLMDDDKGTGLFDWERRPPSKKIFNSNGTFGPSAWSFDTVDDSEKRRSPISEESCSSAAGQVYIRKTYVLIFPPFFGFEAMKKPSPSVKNEMNQKDELHISLDKLDIPNMDAHLHGRSLFNSPEKVDRKGTTDQKKLETSYWPESVTEQPRTREPSCRLSLKEKFSNWGSPTFHLKDSTGLTNQSSCTVMHKDKPSFHASPDLSMYQTVESTEKIPASKVHSVSHGPDDAIFEDDIHMQQPVSDMFGDKIELSNPFRTKDLQSDIDMSTFFGQKVDKKQEDDFPTFSNRSTDSFPAGKAVSSVRTVGGHSTCSQPSGKGSFRHGFSPGFNFQGSESNTFWGGSHVSNDTFRGNLEFSGLLARKNSDKNEVKIEAPDKPDTRILPETRQFSADQKNEMNGTETCSNGSEVSNCSEVQKETSSAATQIPVNLSCLQETSAELFQVQTHARPVTREKLENPGVDFKAPMHSRSKIHDVGDHSKLNAMFQSPFVGEKVGIEKKIITSVSPDNSDVQYQFMLEQRVLRRLCVQKIVVPTPMKDKLEKDTRFRIVEDGSHALPKSV